MTYKSLYHKTDDFGEFSGGEYFSNQSITGGQKVFVISSQQINGKTKTPFLEGEFVITEKQKGPVNHNGKEKKFRYLLEDISKLDKNIDLTKCSITQNGRKEFKNTYMNEFIPFVTSEHIQIFKDLIATNQSSEVFESDQSEIVANDIKSILVTSTTEVEQTILARLGQGKFRENVIKTWGYSGCAATLTSIKGCLTASHIKPWRECTGDDEWQRLDGANGIILCAHIDRLFDRHLISFKPSRSGCGIELSRLLNVTEIAQLGISRDLELAPNAMNAEEKERFLGYLSEHYQQFLSINQ